MKNLLKDIKLLIDGCDSNYALEINGYKRGVTDTLELVKKHLDLSEPLKSQIWCEKNLDVTHFRNGDEILHANTPELWKQAGLDGTPAWCYYENNPENGAKYGKLYNWYAVNDYRGLAPEGEHIPTDDEMTKLSDIPNALPGGFSNEGSFYLVGDNGYLWSATESGGNAWTRFLYYTEARVYRTTHYKSVGFSVRCVKN